jgi:hypothetical protein
LSTMWWPPGVETRLTMFNNMLVKENQ